MSDEEDYMSCSFLEVQEDIRPGLAFSRGVKRKYEIEKKQTISNALHKIKPLRQLEEESRNQGLDSAISSNNKGFAMLQKMGYKPGMKLGAQKEGSSDRGLIEPIRIDVKKGRGGLGREEEVRNNIQRIKERREKMKVYKERETELLTKEFQQRIREERLNKRLMSDLHKCQKVCEQLDKESEIKEPSREWFWYTQVEEEEFDDDYEPESDEEPDDLNTEEKTEIIVDYLRSNYFYCVWCCVRYSDFEDMEKNCPGSEKSNHDDFDE